MYGIMSFHLHEKQHLVIKDVLRQVISHFQCRVQFKMLCRQLFMQREAEACLVPVVCIVKFLPGHSFAFNFQTSRFSSLAAFLDVIPYFLNVVLVMENKPKRNGQFLQYIRYTHAL